MQNETRSLCLKAKMNMTTSPPLEWVCPECFAMLAPPKSTRSQAQEAFGRHANGSHLRSYLSKTNRNPPSRTAAPKSNTAKPLLNQVSLQPLQPVSKPKTSPVQKVWCTESGCTWQGSLGDIVRHLQADHSGPKLKRTPVSEFPFELLPPGEWNIDHVLQHYRRVPASASYMAGRVIDHSRLKAIEDLDPTRCYVGKQAWHGYVAFEFSECQGAVLECPFRGNATYVVYGNNWRQAISLTKAEVRAEWRHWKIVHSVKWMRKLKQALRMIGYVLRRS